MSATISLYLPTKTKFDNYEDACAWERSPMSTHLYQREIIDYTLQKYHAGRAWNRIKKRLDQFQWQRLYDKYQGNYMKYLPCDIVCYAQGWFFTKKFFKKKHPYIICTTKKQMISMLDKYITYEDKYHDAGYIRKIRRKFIDSWEDGMLFEMAW